MRTRLIHLAVAALLAAAVFAPGVAQERGEAEARLVQQGRVGAGP